MPELFREMYYGPNVQNLVESDDCKVMRLSDNSGEGMMTLYHVFPGVFLMYNDFHMKECVSGLPDRYGPALYRPLPGRAH